MHAKKDSLANTADLSASARRFAWRRFNVIFTILLAAIFAVWSLSLFARARQLTDTEREFIGAWEMKNPAGATTNLLFFHENGCVTIASPPSSTFLSGVWNIDELNSLHIRSHDFIEVQLTRSIEWLLNHDSSLVDYGVRVSDEGVILTMRDGTEHPITRYDGPQLKSLKEFR